MRVFQIDGDWSFDHLKLAERPEPTAGPGEVVLRMRRASLNARDLIVPLRGYGRGTGELPLIPLSDGVGEVVEIGEGVTRVAVGDRVCPLFFQNWQGGEPSPAAFASSLGGPIDGTAAEMMRLSAEGVARVPDHLTDAEAAALPCAALTAWSAISTYGRLRAGDRILIQGTGGVALSALQFAKALGAHATGISSSDEKLEKVRALGADETLNYRQTEDWARAFRDMTADRGGFDHILELGGAQTLPLSVRAIRPGGVISLIGVLSGLKPDLSLGAVVTRQVRLQGITVGHREGCEAMCRAIAAHGIHPVIGESFPLEDLHAAFDRVRAGDAFGKTVVELG